MTRVYLLICLLLLIDYSLIAKTKISEIIKYVVINDGPQRAVEVYSNLKRTAASEYDWDIEHLDKLVADLIEQQYIEEALSVAALNIAAYPTSELVYASMGLAQLAKGDTTLAIEYFDKSQYIRHNHTSITWLHQLLKGSEYERKVVGDAGHIYAYSPYEMYDYNQISHPEAEGVAVDKVIGWYEKAAQIPQLYNMTISRNDKMIAEHYFQYNQNIRTDMREGTEAFVSMLLGIAIKQGKVSGLNSSIGNYLAEKGLHGATASLSFKDLVSGKSGLYASDDQIKQWRRERYKLSYTSRLSPGTKTFGHNALAGHLLAAAIQESTGASLFRYAKVQLFHPMIIYPTYWTNDHLYFNYGTEGLCLYSREMVALGQLILNMGQYPNGGQLVPSDWMAKATTKFTDLSKPSSDKHYLRDHGYGYGFHIYQSKGHKVIIAQGSGGQNIVAVPSKRLLITTAADQFDLGGEEAILDLIFEIVDGV